MHHHITEEQREDTGGGGVRRIKKSNHSPVPKGRIQLKLGKGAENKAFEKNVRGGRGFSNQSRGTQRFRPLKKSAGGKKKKWPLKKRKKDH